MKLAVRTALAAGLLTLASMPAIAADKPEDVVKYREYLMEIIGGHTQSFGAIAGGKISNKADMAYHADALAAAATRVKAAFAQNTAGSGVKTEAKDAIWAAGSEFPKMADDFEKAAAQLASAVKSGDGAAIGAAAKGLGCKGCHDKFKAD